MHLLDGAREEFSLAQTTEVTVVDRISSAQLLASRGGRRPEDARADRISLRKGAAEHAVFWGATSWASADLMLVAWADTVRLGRSLSVSFEVQFGDGTVYLGEVPITRGIKRGRARLAEQCRRVETFAACFCPTASLPADAPRVVAMMDYFLKNYEIGAPVSVRQRKTTPVASVAA